MTENSGATTYVRGCRALLLAYPRSYRDERGEEILSTLLDSAVPGQRLPCLIDATDVVAAGLRTRLGTPSLAGFDAGLVAAAPIALTLAAGISAFAWWRVEPVGAGLGAPAFLGGFRTIGPVAYLAWLLAALARVVLPATASRAAVGVATGVTVAVPALAAMTGYDRPPLWVLMALTVFGLLAFAGTPIGTRVCVDERISVAAGSVGVALVSSALVAAWPPAGGGFGYYYQPTIARVGAVVAGTVGVVAGYALVLAVRGRRITADGGRRADERLEDGRRAGEQTAGVRRPGGRLAGGPGAQPWLWATALLGLPAGWLGPFDSAGLRLAADNAVPHFGRLAQVLLATGVATVTIAGLARLRTTAAGSTPGSLVPAGAGTIGVAAGLAAFLGLGAHGRLGFAHAESGAWPGHVQVTLAALVVAGVCGIARPFPMASAGRAFLGGFAVAVPAAWLVSAYDNGWTTRGWPDFAHTAALVATLAFLPFALCVVASLRLLARRRRAAGSAVAMLTVSLAWVAYAAVPSVFSWGPVVVVLVSGCAVLGITSVPRSPRGG